QLSDIVFAEVSIETGESVEAGDCIGTVESVKAASDIYTPVTGTVAAVNETIADEPETINKDAFGAAWFIKVTLDGAVDESELMDAAAYEKYCAEREH
ncbi:MAG: glycine cleavage system protein H, partial [Clostridia bacterium]|nr:glycine cleavage system protein H [Clostridia bacterium]